jgi:protein-L-isoaspartate(D-aspartate) O-methyltransferase
MSDSAQGSGQDFDAARRVMVSSQLRPEGVTDAHILAAMGSVARENYVGPRLQSMAYSDRSLRLDNDAPMMPPAELGQLLNHLAPVTGERALVVGGGGAYAAAILRHIGLEVDATDSTEAPDNGPYDIILVEGAIEHFPPSLAQCLAASGRVGAAIVEDGVTRLATGRASDSSSKSVAFTSFAEAQVPILPGFSSAPAFVF